MIEGDHQELGEGGREGREGREGGREGREGGEGGREGGRGEGENRKVGEVMEGKKKKNYVHVQCISYMYSTLIWQSKLHTVTISMIISAKT